MHVASHLAKHFREVFFGGNWTGVNLKDTLNNVTWQQATTSVESFNTIASLVFHINYYVSVGLTVLEGGPLDAHDKYSFDVPPITSPKDWDQLLDKTWNEAERFATAIEQLPEEIFWEVFVEEKYRTYYRNLSGVIQHSHYHLGQIVVLKKLVLAQTPGVGNR